MKKVKISAVILTKNEESNIERAVKSVLFCDEIIIIDDYSEDKTLEIVKRINPKIRIYKRHLEADFASQRNFALEKAIGDWILFIDADEIVTDELRQEIIQKLETRNPSTSLRTSPKLETVCFYLKRRDYFWGRELQFGETMKIRRIGLIRLIRRDVGKWLGKVHEVFNTTGKTATLENYLEHYPHQTVREFISDVNFYSTLRAKELFDQGRKVNIFPIIFFPLAKFLLNYFIYLGFLDGPAGFGYAFMMSFHSFLVRSKLYQMHKIDKKNVG